MRFSNLPIDTDDRFFATLEITPLLDSGAYAYSTADKSAFYEKNWVLWVWFFGVLGAMYNQIFRVHLDRSTWIGVNWFTVGVIAVAAAFFWRKQSRNARSEGVSENDPTRSHCLPVKARRKDISKA